MESTSIEIRICFKLLVQYFSSQDTFPYHCPISDGGKLGCILVIACQFVPFGSQLAVSLYAGGVRSPAHSGCASL